MRVDFLKNSSLSVNKPEVYNIPAGAPFAECLAEGILQRYADQKEKLASVSVFLPSRRGVRALKEAFEKKIIKGVMFLPKIYPLGESPEETAPPPPDAQEAERLLATKVPVNGGIRQAALTEIITSEATKRGEPIGHSEAFALAQTLSETLDSLHSERVPLSALHELDMGEHAEAWQKNLEILKIVTEDWPQFCEEKGVIDAILFRNAMLEAFTARLAANPSADPMIVAGSTGSMPATADFMAVVARVPGSFIVLPGADLALTPADQAALTADHPQYGLHNLLTKLEIGVKDVKNWSAADQFITNRTLARQKLFREVMRPSATSEMWKSFRERVSETELIEATEGLRMIAAPAEREEATAIAVIMREAAEIKGKSVALVTPNRMLATRVQSALARWNMRADDSAGVPVSDTAYGVFYKLLDDLFETNFTPTALLAFLKHPLTCLGRNPGEFKNLARLLERKVFRGRKFPPGLSRLQDYLETKILECDHPEEAENAHGDLNKRKADFIKILSFLQEVRSGLEPMISAPAFVTPREFITAVEKTSVSFAATDTFKGEDRLGYSEDYRTARRALEKFAEATHLLGKIPQSALRRHLRESLVKETVRDNYAVTPNLYIWGTPEARLQQTDIVILGGLTEESWPIIPDTGVWLSRLMRKDLGLTAPERRVGLSAHDFTQAVCAPEVFITYSRKADRKPAIPSRWLIRTESLLSGAFGGQAIRKMHDTPYLEWARQLDEPEEIKPETGRKKYPRPPVSARPRELSVTDIETWRRDPYAIYAKHILKLKPLDALDEVQEAREYGKIAHSVFEKLRKEFLTGLPSFEETKARFDEIIDKLIRERALPESEILETKTRFSLTISPFYEQELKSRENGFRTAMIEEAGAITFRAEGGDFTLKVRADLIDYSEDQKSAMIYDYKTGSATPSEKQILCGLSPQLPLTGAILREGGFLNLLTVPANIRASYIQIPGRGAAPFFVKEVCAPNAKQSSDFNQTIEKTMEGLKNYIAIFDKQETPYPPRLAPKSAQQAGDYDRLARITLNDEEDGDEENEAAGND